MPLDETADKPANINTTAVSEFHNDLFRQQESVKLGSRTQEVSLPEGGTVFKPDLGGLIKDIRLPGTWTKVHQEPAPHGFQTELYSFNQSKGVFMSYKYRGGDPYITAKEICKVMKEPPHKLTPTEIKEVRVGLFDNDQDFNDKNPLQSESPDPFDLKQAWTQTVHDHKVLFVEGVHKQDPIKGLHVLTAYLDSDPTRSGRLPESITYFAQGGQAEFNQYLPMAMQAFKSMEFKAHVDTSNPM